MGLPYLRMQLIFSAFLYPLKLPSPTLISAGFYSHSNQLKTRPFLQQGATSAILLSQKADSVFFFRLSLTLIQFYVNLKFLGGSITFD